MRHCLFILIFLFPTFALTAQKANEDILEAFLDSIISANNIDVSLATGELLSYSKKNYKAVDNVQEFVKYAGHKMKSKEKEFTKNYTRELQEFHAIGVAAHKNVLALEKKLFSILDYNSAVQSNDLITLLYLTIHEMNYWEMNCYKPNQIGVRLEKLYSTTENTALVEKINLLLIAAKIYKGSYFVNPMHICVSKYAKIEVVMDLDSLNLKTKNITIDSIPSGIRPPVFIGGHQMLKTYVKSNLRYPEKAMDMGHQGRVLASFKVDEWGNVFGIRIKQSPSEFLSKEVIRLLESLPQWEPDSGTQAGAGFTKFTMPFEFVLPEK
ncbi:MAG: TonB family protein [Crocinitomicaceae bacterium]